MLEINPFSVVSFTIISSYSVSCLFTLLRVSFAVRKPFKLNQVPLVYVFPPIILEGGL